MRDNEIISLFEMRDEHAIEVLSDKYHPYCYKTVSYTHLYYLQSILSVKSSLFISLLRNVILSSTAILTFPLIFGGNSLWLVMPVVECLVLVLSVVFLRRQQ